MSLHKKTPENTAIHLSQLYRRRITESNLLSLTMMISTLEVGICVMFFTRQLAGIDRIKPTAFPQGGLTPDGWTIQPVPVWTGLSSTLPVNQLINELQTHSNWPPFWVSASTWFSSWSLSVGYICTRPTFLIPQCWLRKSVDLFVNWPLSPKV